MKVRFIDVLKEAASEFSEDRVPRLASSLAYYTLFSVAPLLLIAIAISGIIFGEEAARGEIVGSLRTVIGENGATMIEEMVQNAAREKTSVLAAIAGFATLLIGASGVFGQLHEAFNTIWEVEPKKGGGISGFIRQRFMSFAMVLGVGFLLLVSLLLSAALAAVGKFFGAVLPGGETLWHIVNLVVAFAVISGLFAAMFRYLPDIRIPWRDALIGGVFTSALFTIGKFAIGIYLGKSSVASTYGAAGSLVVLLIWIYYSGLILFLGAEFAEVYSRRRSGVGSRAELREEKARKRQERAQTRPAVAGWHQPQPSPSRPRSSDSGGLGKAVAAGIGGLIVGALISAVGLVKVIRKAAGI